MIFLSFLSSLVHSNIKKKIWISYASFHRCGSSIENVQQWSLCYCSQVINSLIEASYAVERKTSSSHHFTRKIELKWEEKRDNGIQSQETNPTSSSGISLYIAAVSIIHPFHHSTRHSLVLAGATSFTARLLCHLEHKCKAALYLKVTRGTNLIPGFHPDHPSYKPGTNGLLWFGGSQKALCSCGSVANTCLSCAQRSPDASQSRGTWWAEVLVQRCAQANKLRKGRHGIKLTQLHNPRLELACSHSQWAPATHQTCPKALEARTVVWYLCLHCDKKTVLFCWWQLRAHQCCGGPVKQSITNSLF